MLRVFVMLVGLVTLSAPVAAKTELSPLEAASKWLQAVASGDPAETTSMPFTFATTAKVKRCERTVTDRKALAEWLTCVRKSDQLLVNEVRRGTLMPSDPAHVESPALRSLASKISARGKWIEAFINGDGVTYTFRFLLLGGAVAAFLVEADFEAP
jgi:hypothetical protein